MSSGAQASDKKGILPPQVAAAYARVRGVVAGLTRPAKVLIGSTIGVALILGAWLLFRSINEPYATLFTQLDREDAGALVAKLKELKVPYRLSGDGTIVEVPEAKVHELRLELAQAGLPRGGGVGFESFDKMRLGATEFEQRVLYRRALEGELARTIGSIAAVQNARVHLVLPEKSVFVSKNEPASASVVVKLRGGRLLSPGEISGVVRLVASAVPGLGPERVTLVTTEGTLLHGLNGGGAGTAGADGALTADGTATSAARTMESNLEARAREMLERVMGPSHVDVRVTAEMDLARVEHQEDLYNPTKTALRSETASKELGVGAGVDSITAAGVPGAESNVPGGDATATAASATPAGKVVKESHTRNFEVDHVQEKRVTTGGVLRRLTVAVVVDGIRPAGGGPAQVRSKEELAKIASLVKAAVGVDEKRGDLVTVESVPFDETEVAVAAATPKGIAWTPIAEKAKKYWKFELAGVGVLALLMMVMVMRARTRAKIAAAEVAQLEAAAKAPALVATSEEAAAELPGTPEPKALEAPRDWRAEAHDRAENDPATAALVLRSWLGTADVAELGAKA
jgi:flagellar M-ring protein FliF